MLTHTSQLELTYYQYLIQKHECSLLSNQPGPAIGAHLDLPQGLVHAAAHLDTCIGLQGLMRAAAQRMQTRLMLNPSCKVSSSKW